MGERWELLYFGFTMMLNQGLLQFVLYVDIINPTSLITLLKMWLIDLNYGTSSKYEWGIVQIPFIYFFISSNYFSNKGVISYREVVLQPYLQRKLM